MTASKKPSVSFEFFPPKSFPATFGLWNSLQALVPVQPRFVSVTYGAHGSSRGLTLEVSETISKQLGIDVAAHLTCIGATRAEAIEIADSYLDAGIRQVVALRGDARPDDDGRVLTKDGFAHSVDFVSALERRGFEEIWVGAYPELHPESRYEGADIEWLKRKMDAGATGAITQFFFDHEVFLRFRDDCVAAGITIPIVPGVLPIDKWDNARKFALKCGASVPPELDREFAMAKRNGVESILSVVVATDICAALMEEGVDRFHFYTLNRPRPTLDVCVALGLWPEDIAPRTSPESSALDLPPSIAC